MSIHSHFVAPDKLVQIVRPFVGTGRAIHRGNSAIDVLHTMNSVDTSIRSVDALGVEIVSGDFARFIPWAEVRSITVRGIRDEETTSTTVYANAAAKHPLRDVPRQVAA